MMILLLNIDVLNTLVHEKLLFSKKFLDNDSLKNITEGEKINLYPKARQFNDSISLVTHRIENSRQKLLTKIALIIDNSGKNALKPT
ncbi:MAG: hypothetical protein ABI863_10405 [Ginsengibacter sp.]